MSEETTDNEIRSQAGLDDARLEARMKAIMEQHAPRAPKARATPAPSGNPDWMNAKPKVKPQAATLPERPVRAAAKRKAPAVKPPKNSEESWKLAAEYVAKKQSEE